MIAVALLCHSLLLSFLSRRIVDVFCYEPMTKGELLGNLCLF